MPLERFDHLLSLVTPLILKKDTKFRKSIFSNECLALPLRFFASEELEFNSDWEELQSQRFFLSAAKLFIKCCPRNIYEVLNYPRSGKRLNNNLKIHGICRTSLAQSMVNMFELNVQETLEAYTTTTRDFLALFY